MKKSLENFNYKEKSKLESRNQKAQKYIPKIIDIIKETKVKEKRILLPQMSKASSKISAISKASSKIIDSNTNKNKTNKNAKTISGNKEKKDLKLFSRKSKTINLLKEKKNVNAVKAPPPQITKE